MSNVENLKKATEIVKNSEKIVVFTGAGASTESGIADFRSEGLCGLATTLDLCELPLLSRRSEQVAVV